MDIETLKRICAGTPVAHRLAGQILSNSNITPTTVRSKGQYRTQRLFYIRGGKAKFELNNKTIHCHKGDILYLPADITYVCYWEEGNHESSAILIQFDLYVSNVKISLSDDMFIIMNDEHGTYLKQFLLFANTYSEGRFGYKIQCQSMFLSILHSLVTELVEDSSPTKSNTVYKGILYIENHYMDEINVNELAKMCSLCPTAFRSQFHAVTGMSPIQYKNDLTMKKAAELLRSGLYTASKVAMEVGINDICYFNRMFKKYYHISPGKYKHNHMNHSATQPNKQ